MNFKMLCKAHGWPFVAGIAAAVVGKRIIQSKAVHNAAVKVVAKGLMIKDEAQSTLETIKEESQDLYAEAVAEKAKKEAESFSSTEKAAEAEA